MKIFIFGIGRSGTSFLTELVREIIYSSEKIKPMCIYEPFLWGEDIWDRDYIKENNLYEKMSSLSYEGIYNHLKLPLFINNEDIPDNAYLNKIINRSGKGQNSIIKFVRANGRVNLINKIEPMAKHIFIIRNPIDTMNSVVAHGSLLGDEWHKSDDDRMYKELNSMNYNPKVSKHYNLFRKELDWWYYMNRFYLENSVKSEIDTLFLSYDYLVDNFLDSMKKICNHTNIEFDQKYLNLIRIQRGSKTSKINLTKENINDCQSYMKKYQDLLIDFDIVDNKNFEKIYNKYQNPINKNYDRNFLGLTPAAVKSKLNQEKIYFKIKSFLRNIISFWRSFKSF